MSNPKVSIIIPVYNIEKYIAKALDSLLVQSLSDIEIICVDDNSSDNSLKILKEYQKKDSRIKIVEQKENKGQASARNKALEKAAGEYIGFVDGDDWVKDSMFQKLYDKAKGTDSDLVLSSAYSFDEQKGLIDKENRYYSTDIYDETFDNKVFSYKDNLDSVLDLNVVIWNKLYKKSFLIENNIRFNEGFIYEDLPFITEVYLKAKKVTLVRDFLYYYRENRENSTMSNHEKKIFDRIGMVSLTLDILKKTPEYKVLYPRIFTWVINDLFHRFVLIDAQYRQNFYKKMQKIFQGLDDKNIPPESLDNIYYYKEYKLVKEKTFEEYNQVMFKEYVSFKERENHFESDKQKELYKQQVVYEGIIDQTKNLTASFYEKMIEDMKASSKSFYENELNNLKQGYDRDFWQQKDNYEKALGEVWQKHAALTQDNALLNIEREKLLQDNNNLVQYNSDLLQEKERLLQDNNNLVQYNSDLLQEKERLLQDNNNLVQYNSDLLQEKERLLQDNDNLVQYNSDLLQEKERLLQDNNNLVQYNNDLNGQNDNLSQENLSLRQENDNLIQQNIDLNEQNNILIQENASLAQHNNDLNEQNNHLSQENAKFLQENAKLLQDNINIVQYNNDLLTEKEQLTKDKVRLIAENEELIKKYKKDTKYLRTLIRVLGAVRDFYNNNKKLIKEKLQQKKNIEAQLKPKVSIVLPIYNVGQYLKESLDSLINQELKEIEIICVNDGSTDNSAEILEEYRKKDNRIIVINKPNNQGTGIARNDGLKLATGECIGFVDPDDWVKPNMFKRLYEVLKEKDVDIVMSLPDGFNEGTQTLEPFPYFVEGNFSPDLDNKIFNWREISPFKYPMCVWNKLYTKKLFDENNISFAEGLDFEDHKVIFKSLLCADKIYFIREKFYVYRFNRGGSILSDNNRRLLDHIEIFDIVENILKETNTYDSLRMDFLFYKIHNILYYYSMIKEEFKEEYRQKMVEAIAETDLKEEELKELLPKYPELQEYLTA